MVQFGPSVNNVVIYTDGRMSRPGTLTLHEIALTDVVCLTTVDAVGRCPLELSGFALNPLTDPYVDESGHVIFDLTYMDKPPRICFHDPAQELGISINFSDQESFDAAPQPHGRLPGFY
jgi:hypothetical protein